MKDLSNENIVHVNKNGIEYIQFRKLLEYPNINHALTLKPLNFEGFSTYEKNKEKITREYQKICDILNIDYKNICRPKQTHTSNVRSVEDGDEGIYNPKYTDVDGLVTNKSNKALVVAFADCMPLLFFDPVRNVIANTHSGWRGTVALIGKETVEKMIKDYECNPKDIICCIGPTIRQCHFKVDEDVKDIFYNQFKDKIQIEKYITNKNKEFENELTECMERRLNSSENKYYIDTVEINKQVLLKMGLKEENIIDSKICTVCEEKQIHSYRAHGKKAGRNISIIEKIK